jgi:hypothetical protein
METRNMLRVLIMLTFYEDAGASKPFLIFIFLRHLPYLPQASLYRERHFLLWLQAYFGFTLEQKPH